MAEKIIDACCLINLYSTGMEATILRACADEFHVSTQVQNEALTIRQFNDEDPPHLVSQPIDLANLISDDLVSLCEPEGEDETDAYVQFATLLDDGEASCLAIAKNRGWTVATDDRKATRIASESGIAVITTVEVVRKWVANESPSDEQIVEVLQKIEQFARYRPRRGSPESAWWYQVLDDASA
jgi:predicted nucleic acid-binding protein